jgi:hypothetical protein
VQTGRTGLCPASTALRLRRRFEFYHRARRGGRRRFRWRASRGGVQVSDVSASSTLESVRLRVRLRVVAFPNSTATPSCRRTGNANRNCLPKALGSVGHFFQLVGVASDRSAPLGRAPGTARRHHVVVATGAVIISNRTICPKDVVTVGISREWIAPPYISDRVAHE